MAKVINLDEARREANAASEATTDEDPDVLETLQDHLELTGAKMAVLYVVHEDRRMQAHYMVALDKCTGPDEAAQFKRDGDMITRSLIESFGDGRITPTNKG